MNTFLTVADVGRLVDPPITPGAVRGHVARGNLRVSALTPKGVRLFSREAVEEFLADRAAAAAAKRITRGQASD